jgi:hypothetical protein
MVDCEGALMRYFITVLSKAIFLPLIAVLFPLFIVKWILSGRNSSIIIQEEDF